MQTPRFRNEKLHELFRSLAARFLEEESNRTSLITVTGVEVSRDKKHAVILFTVLPEDKEEAALSFVERKGKAFGDYVRKNSKVGRIPRFEFALDAGEKNRQRIDFLLQND